MMKNFFNREKGLPPKELERLRAVIRAGMREGLVPLADLAEKLEATMRLAASTAENLRTRKGKPPAP